MRIIKKTGAALLPLIIALSACSGASTMTDKGHTKPQAAELSIFVDGSSSTAFISSTAYANAAIRRASDEVMRLKLGDSVRIVSFGARSADNAVDVLSLRSGYNLRLPATRKRVEAAIHDLMAHNRTTGGQHSTDGIYAFEQSAIRCTPTSTVVILSDGLMENEQFSTSKILAEGKAVHFPSPTTPFLKGGCSVEVLGVGMAPGIGQDTQTLPNEQVQRLEAGLREYFKAAGAQDISFASVL